MRIEKIQPYPKPMNENGGMPSVPIAVPTSWATLTASVAIEYRGHGTRDSKFILICPALG